MNNGAAGFTLVEILVVIAIIGILSTIGVVQAYDWQTKAAVKNEIMTIYGELMRVRQSAMNFKRPRSVIIKSGSFQVYSTTVTSVSPVINSTLRYPLLKGSGLVAVAGEKITFDERGFTTDGNSFCVEPTGDTLKLNHSAVDSIVISGLRLRVGKRIAEGASCDSTSNNIQLK